MRKGFNDSFHYQDPQYTVYKGKDYKDVYFNNYPSRRSASFMLYPEGKYQKLYLQVAATGSDIDEFIIEDSDKDVILKSTQVSISDGMKTIEVDIAGSKELYVHAEDVQEGGGVFIPLTTSYYK
ncbi:hypothetical protein [Paenibacillus hexagrammi]|uniref:hypothetical protein n=1 Tax=Paenibacillus hexagrammi TaxID=2908839 RepID=UPI0028832152|nr:hypothetical protein [Paenibacillus sp. YPD9-1]